MLVVCIEGCRMFSSGKVNSFLCQDKTVCLDIKTTAQSAADLVCVKVLQFARSPLAPCGQLQIKQHVNVVCFLCFFSE